MVINQKTHDFILFFTNKGKVYRLKGYEIPKQSRQGKGIPIINLIGIDKDEEVSSIISIPSNEYTGSLLFVTKNGVIKKTTLEDFENIRTNGKIAINLKEDDILGWLQINESQAEIHIQALAEAMWDAYNESTPKKLESGEWHIPFSENMDEEKLNEIMPEIQKTLSDISGVRILPITPPALPGGIGRRARP